MEDAFIYSGKRTPIGRHGGALSSVRPDDLAGELIGKIVAQSGFGAEDIEDVVLGCTNQAGEDCRNVARNAALIAGLPVSVGGITVNRLCASGLAAVADAARAINAGQGELFIAGGVESMSRAPFAMGKAERAFDRKAEIYDTTIGARFPNRRITGPFGDDTMPETADNVARDYQITREASDVFALASQQNYAEAKKNGFFDDEIEPTEVPGRKRGESTTVSDDEHPRPDVTPERLAALGVLFEGGVVTAGNASGINDGAAAMIVASRAAGEKAGQSPIARIKSAAVAGVEPRVMGLGPVPACQKALARAGLELKDIDVIEINEAFAAQVLGCLRGLEMSFDDSRVNGNGGAIAVGHPLGASGARLALTAARRLHAEDGRYAMVSLCIGIGQGLAVILEKV